MNNRDDIDNMSLASFSDDAYFGEVVARELSPNKANFLDYFHIL